MMKTIKKIDIPYLDDLPPSQILDLILEQPLVLPEECQESLVLTACAEKTSAKFKQKEDKKARKKSERARVKTLKEEKKIKFLLEG